MPGFSQKIKSWLKNFQKGTDGEYAREGFYPARDWKMFLILAFALLCIIGIFSLYLYVEINQGNLFTGTSEGGQAPVMFKTDLLQKTVNDINLRQKTLEDAKQNKTSAPDPSI